MKDFAIIIKKNICENSMVKDNLFYIKSILHYGLNISENNVLFLNYTNLIEDFYHNIVCIKEYAYNLITVTKRTLYVYIDNSEDDLIDNTYSSYYFYSVLELFICKTIFIQYAGIILYDEPIFRYYLGSNFNKLTAELSDIYQEFHTPIILIDNYTINDMILNLIEFNNTDIDLFTFILNNNKCTIYSNNLISKNMYLFKINLNEELCIFVFNGNALVKNFLNSIYVLHNDNNFTIL